MGNHNWKVEKQPEWYVKAVRKTIAALPGGYAESAEWLGVTENALFNRLRADGDQIFPLGWAMVLQRAAGTHYIADAVAQSAGGVFVSLPEIEAVENADINQRLIENIFFKNSPLHDGAMVISNKRIKAAGCILPVSHNLNIPKELGLRHRAALGVSQETDAMAIIVSEETGGISIAYKGEFYLKLNAEELERMLTNTDETSAS